MREKKNQVSQRVGLSNVGSLAIVNKIVIKDKWIHRLEEINKSYALQVNALARDYFTTRLPVGAAAIN